MAVSHHWVRWWLGTEQTMKNITNALYIFFLNMALYMHYSCRRHPCFYVNKIIFSLLKWKNMVSCWMPANCSNDLALSLYWRWEQQRVRACELLHTHCIVFHFNTHCPITHDAVVYGFYVYWLLPRCPRWRLLHSLWLQVLSSKYLPSVASSA